MLNYFFNSDAATLHRRRFLRDGAAALAATAAAPAFAGIPNGQTPGARLALLLGNRQYPSPHDLPPVHKNIADLSAALSGKGFAVTSALDLDSTALKAQVQAFAQAVKNAPADAIVFFYFTGHGVQVDAENLMLGAPTDPSVTPNDAIVQGSLHLQRDLLDVLPARPNGATITVIDACRTSLHSNRANDGLNQVNAPPGCLIVFSTGAGKPAIAPAVETQNTFYTAALLKVLQNAPDNISFPDLFELSKTDVQETMLNHPVAAIRQMAQFPFIASNLRVQAMLAPTFKLGQGPTFADTDEQSAWQQLQASAWPSDVVKLAQAFIQQFPQSALRSSVGVVLNGAQAARAIVRRNDIRLFKSAFIAADADSMLNDDLRKAGRGDKDAAARVAHAYLKGQHGVAPNDDRYEGWMQYAAALGNGIAAYELSLHYRKLGQPVLISQYEALAIELGYTPPPALSHSRK